ncbi:bifunctional serine/threonine-protein kinase/formylglycine-generating enzyme family protein [Roseimicrobium gellanilyticum]|nr:bifunctional serine/threonine-protein kinase/formylglycine-generating enzyme family protein [Roseimicrobium gellanilyticum]
MPPPKPAQEQPAASPAAGGPSSGMKPGSARGSGQARTSQEPLSSRDEDIPIPDLKLIRRIGSGAYGEVWLAQTITGALRAVKVVWREDFEYEKTFHREFEGIQQFEPISRGHPGLVNVLHVGWNENRGFYYYVMELADDADRGKDIDITTYVPRTLTTDFKTHGRLNLEFCKQTGIYLADALGYMHSYGLTHRDIKPSNIIFVGGVCKLADIGLVAAHGERSFVGTEGFVPPEGPGTFASDIYSLGKVLYEISSGKDRMEFPEVPDDLTAGEWKLWREWNGVICQACAPNLKERFASAADFAEALRTVGVPKPVPMSSRLWGAAWRLVLGSFLFGALLAVSKRTAEWRYVVQAPESRELTPEEIAQAKLPRQGRMWLNSFDLKFNWKGDRHVAEKPVTLESLQRFLDDSMQSFEGEVVPTFPKGGKPEYPVVVPKTDADAFAEWMTKYDQEAGALDANYEYAWKQDTSVKRSAANADWVAFRLEVVRLHFGHVIVESSPGRAEVMNNGVALGPTPLALTRMKVGNAEFVVNLPGYKREVLKGKVEEGKTLKLVAKLKPTDAVAFGRKWKNSLGMDFVPLGDVLMAATETRRADYATFLRTLPTSQPPLVDVRSDVTLPMTHVSRTDAELFCKWLTMVERTRGLLEPSQSYRLPTDDEWSMAAGLPRERGDSPASRSQRALGIYPWGFSWPPSPVPGNMWDRTAATKAKRKDGIEDFNDGFADLSPVGSFEPNENGLRDLAGNVWEWVQDDFGGEDQKLRRLGAVRGGGFRSGNKDELLASHRKAMPPGTRGDEIGFRVVLSEEGVTARQDDE